MTEADNARWTLPIRGPAYERLGRLSTYYPLSDEAQREYELWRAEGAGASDA